MRPAWAKMGPSWAKMSEDEANMSQECADACGCIAYMLRERHFLKNGVAPRREGSFGDA